MARFLLLLVQLDRLQFPRLLILPHNVVFGCWCRCGSIATTAASTGRLMLLKLVIFV